MHRDLRIAMPINSNPGRIGVEIADRIHQRVASSQRVSAKFFWMWCRNDVTINSIPLNSSFRSCTTERVFIWRRPALLVVGRASPIVRGLDFTSRLHGKSQPSYPRNPISAAYKFSFYNLHINKQSLWNEKLSKKCWSRQPLSCVRSFDLLALLGGGPALLSAFIWKISSPPRRDLG